MSVWYDSFTKIIPINIINMLLYSVWYSFLYLCIWQARGKLVNTMVNLCLQTQICAKKEGFVRFFTGAYV